MTPWLTIQLMLEADHMCIASSLIGVEDKDRKLQDQLKLPISLLNLQGTTAGHQLLDLACLGVEDPSSTIFMKAGMRHGNKQQAGGLAWEVLRFKLKQQALGRLRQTDGD